MVQFILLLLYSLIKFTLYFFSLGSTFEKGRWHNSKWVIIPLSSWSRFTCFSMYKLFDKMLKVWCIGCRYVLNCGRLCEWWIMYVCGQLHGIDAGNQ